ncbi:hypothetical membrane fusion protein [Escherichia phage phiKT]|uniref:Hypothetical membrane fusion protein n=1 Tax=Escherichia phage phiKT TaxID=1141519 RepID=H6VUB8_BPPKT|nr:hypothetical membrane fusion protein [Escherichia phage phiKT]AEZ65106.1 hypothetical membrane fusion protein [Escherichia phage phiKT]
MQSSIRMTTKWWASAHLYFIGDFDGYYVLCYQQLHW